MLNSAEISIKIYEIGSRRPNAKFMQKLCQQFPQYAVWLMTDVDDVESFVNKVPVISEETLAAINPRLKKQALKILE